MQVRGDALAPQPTHTHFPVLMAAAAAAIDWISGRLRRHLIRGPSTA
ncbi:MAG: hypothetical protein ICV73_14770 [Acetobacteraceae bacterium]|nr:hypothetical protein [Acetobacteraceae bacterium]